MISNKSVVNRRVLPTILFVALPLLGFLRALLVDTCSSFGAHGAYCYLALPPTAIVGEILAIVLISIPVGVLLNRHVVRRLPAGVRSRCPAWLASPSNHTLGVFVALLLGLVSLVIFNPNMAVWWSSDAGTIERIAAYGLYSPSIGIRAGGMYFVDVLYGMVGLTSLPVRVLIFGILLVSSFLQIVWLYAVAAALVGGFRRARLAVESKKRTT